MNKVARIIYYAVIIGDDGEVHYIRDQYDSESNTDRNDAVSFDDGYFFEKDNHNVR